jgi:hypothetical protein
LSLEALEDRTLPSAFYNLTTLATTAIPSPFAGLSFGNLPSINNQSRVAFVTNAASGNGIWLAGQGQTINVTADFTSHNDSRTYGRGVAINDTNQIVAVDKIGVQYYVRQWDGNNPNQRADLFQAPSRGLAPDDTFDFVQTFTGIDNHNDAAFVVYDRSTAARYVMKEDGGVGTGPYPVHTTNANGAKLSPRPVLTDDGRVLATSNGNLDLAQTISNREFIAGPKNGFQSIDPGAAVSKDGRVVVFTGDRGKGPGLFAAYQTGSGRTIVRLAGEGLDSFTKFDPTGDVAVNNTWGTDRSVTIAFKGTSALGTGIYTVQLSVFGQKANDPNPVNAVSVYASGVKPVALVNTDKLSGSTITDVELGQGINDVGRGQVAFWAQTSDGNQEIVRADPQQVIWVDFNPPDKPVGQMQTNQDLFAQMGVRTLGWGGSTADTLAKLGVTLSPTTVTDAVVNLVQQMYANAGAPVLVLGRSTDTRPAFVPEYVPLPDGSPSQAFHGVYQTVYVGGGPSGGSTWLGLASQPPAAAGALDFYNQIPDSTAVVFVNNILTDGAYPEGKTPATLTQGEIVNGIATIVAHESGHNFGLFHQAPADSGGDPYTGLIMIDGTNSGEFEAPPAFLASAYQVAPYSPSLVGVTQSSANRLDFSTGAPSGDAPNPALLAFVAEGSDRANIGFQAAHTLTVQHLLVGLQSTVADALPTFQDLGGATWPRCSTTPTLPPTRATRSLSWVRPTA